MPSASRNASRGPPSCPMRAPRARERGRRPRDRSHRRMVSPRPRECESRSERVGHRPPREVLGRWGLLTEGALPQRRPTSMQDQRSWSSARRRNYRRRWRWSSGTWKPRPPERLLPTPGPTSPQLRGGAESAHDLRHSFVSNLLPHGDLATISRAAGHANPHVTAKLYSHALGSPRSRRSGAALAAAAAVSDTMLGSVARYPHRGFLAWHIRWGHTLRYFLDGENDLPGACPQCGGALRHRCPSCSAPIRRRSPSTARSAVRRSGTWSSSGARIRRPGR